MENTNDRKVVRVKTPFMIAAALLLTAVGLQATPVTCASLTDTYAALQAAGSCTIGDKTFSDFTFSSATVTNTGLLFTTVNDVAGQYGFDFATSQLFASATNSADLAISFTVAVTDGAKLIDSAEVTQTGVAIAGGIASIGETVCLGSPIVSCPSGNTRSMTTSAGIGGTHLSDSITFSNQSVVGIAKDLSVVGNGGFASISLFSDTVNQASAPEPGFYGVLAAGVAGIFMFAKRRSKKTA
jgi:hypothetical protein